MTDESDPEILLLLDVDRTVINTTSWYRACAEPGLLLDQEGVRRFIELNEQMYGTDPTLSEVDFRCRTLDLLNEYGSGPWTEERFEDAGAATGYRLHMYPEVVSYLRQMRNRYRGRLRVWFITAGYRPFIKGVVSTLMKRHLLNDVHFEMHGSTIRFEDGRCVPGKVMDADGKAAVVCSARERTRAQILLLADDNYHDHAMFDLVEAVGGVGLKVVHESGARSNRTWREFLSHHHPDALTGTVARGSDSSFGLVEASAACASHANVLRNIPDCDNNIGIGVIPEPDFDEALANLCRRLGPPARARVLRECLRELTHRIDGNVYLRGRSYYLGAPPYLFTDTEPCRDRWASTLDQTRTCLRLLDRAGVLDGWNSMPRFQRQLVLTLADHLKNAATQGLDTLIRAETSESGERLIDEEIDQLVDESHLLYWSLVFEKPRLNILYREWGWRRLVDRVGDIGPASFAIRELDDPFVIATAVLTLVEQLDSTGWWPAGILDLASGALDLGHGFRAIAQLMGGGRPAPPIAHLAYSAKEALRDKTKSSVLDSEALLRRLPDRYRGRVLEWREHRADVLVYDNNATTFSSVANVKRALALTCGGDVRAAVACVNYDNIGRPLEPLHQGWESVLDFQPAAEYLTAFSTWRTSAKSLALDEIFNSLTERRSMPALPKVVRAPGDWWFKVCRVHNMYDLSVAIAAGATAIGIHAVSKIGPRYRADQSRHHPLAPYPPMPSALPLPHFEVDAIRAMLKYLPEGIQVVLVTERLPSAVELEQIRRELGLDEQVALQLQCRIGSADLAALAAIGVRSRIAAIGADQEDFDAYFKALDTELDPYTDLILLDFSAHQPDLLAGPASAGTGADIAELAESMRGNQVPVLVADDCSPEQLVGRFETLRRSGVRVVGLDTQNSVEVSKDGQQYRRLAHGHDDVQVLIRKSPDLLVDWSELVYTQQTLHNIATAKEQSNDHLHR
jgi:hypothetical protein